MDGAMITILKNMFTVELIKKTRKMGMEWSSTLETNKELCMKGNGEMEEKKAWANKERKMELSILEIGQEGFKMEQEEWNCQINS